MNKNIFSGLLFAWFFLLSNFSNAAIITSNAAGAGNWFAGGSWIGGIAPVAGDDAVIQAGFTMTVNGAASIQNLTVSGTLISTFAVTVAAGKAFTINAGGNYTHNNASVAATTIFNGVEAFSPTSTIQINTWSATGTPLINSETSNFGNLILNWNSGGVLWNNNGLGVTQTIQGNFTISGSCTTYLSNVAGNVSVTIGGNFSLLTNGYIEVKRNSTGNVTFNVTGSTTISGANSIFYGVLGNNTTAAGSLTYTTTSYTQSGGIFNGTARAGIFGSAGGAVTFTATGAFTMTGGQHIGVNHGVAGNWGVSIYNMQSFNLTGGSVIFNETVITDGRTVIVNVTNDFTCAFSAAADFTELNGIIGGGQNQVYNFTVGGNFSVSGPGGALFQTTQDGTGNQNVVITNDMSITGATDNFANINTCTLAQTVGGNVTFTGCTSTFSNLAASHLDLILGTAAVNWNQTAATVNLCNTNIFSGKTVSLTGTLMGSIQTALTIMVQTGAKLYCANATVTGAGTGAFTLQTGTTLGIGSIGGITSAGATGNVQVPGARSYNSGATYEYYQGLTPQSTGNFTTTTTSGTYPCQVANLVINKSLATNIVNLTNTTDVLSPGVLTLTNGILTTSLVAATAPWVRIPAGSSVSPVGGSVNSYVDGYIRKQGNTSFIFPTGNNSRWRRIEITAPTISTEFEARYVDAAYANTATMAVAPATVLNHVSLIEHWFLTKPFGADAATAKVKLYWEDASTSGILKFDSLTVARWNGAGWENTNCYGSCPANWTTSQPERTYTGVANGVGAAGTIQSNTVSNFSPFTFGSIGAFGPNPLPIELTSFTGYYNDILNVLNWTTASETNNNYFTIERTFDGINFEEVKRISGAGNSTQTLNYSTTDDKQYSGVAYYRLKQTDYNGQFKYSSIIPISHENEDHVSILPNPVAGSDLTLNFNSANEGTCQVNVLDITGKVVQSQEYSASAGSNSFQMDVAELSSGIYFITIRNNDQLNKIKFIKE